MNYKTIENGYIDQLIVEKKFLNCDTCKMKCKGNMVN